MRIGRNIRPADGHGVCSFEMVHLPRRIAMSKKHIGGPGPVPAGNRSHQGTAHRTPDDDAPLPEDLDRGAPDSDHDPKRGTGGYTGKGEHARQQPGPANDG
jgi:hypothetical protein